MINQGWVISTMDKFQPISYQAYEKYLAVIWEDGHESLLLYTVLRDQCPCANCQGEPDLQGRVHIPDQQEKIDERGYHLVGMQPPGHYGLQLVWGDGHATGIYSFNYLRNLCDCNQCRSASPAS